MRKNIAFIFLLISFLGSSQNKQPIDYYHQILDNYKIILENTESYVDYKEYCEKISYDADDLINAIEESNSNYQYNKLIYEIKVLIDLLNIDPSICDLITKKEEIEAIFNYLDYSPILLSEKGDIRFYQIYLGNYHLFYVFAKYDNRYKFKYKITSPKAYEIPNSEYFDHGREIETGIFGGGEYIRGSFLMLKQSNWKFVSSDVKFLGKKEKLY